ncbi:MAG: TRAP transporter large permease subunit, partial [Candidatus Brocadiales bacterium]|nr:TRAP transporter large permease subunit [Candidatus Bathyanammoxibius sp.]
GISDQPMVVLLILVASMMVMTMFIESLAILIIMVPVIIYISNAFGFDPYHFGMVMVMATQIGATTPPVAVGLFVATSIAGTSYDQTLRYCLPFVLALIAVMFLVIFIPWLSTWIPHRYLG